MKEVIEILFRGCVGFFTLLILARILGKQQISQLTFFDYVLGITIGSTAATMTSELDSPLWPHLVGLFVWFGLGFLMQLITLKSRYVSKIMEGEPEIVIMEGKIMENVLRKMRYRVSDLMEQLRIKGIFDLSEIQYAILECDGGVSVVKKAENDPVTLKDLKLKPDKTGINIELIYDGKIVEQNLKDLNRNKAWLEKKLKEQNVNDYKEVFLATVNPKGEVYIDTYKDKLRKIIDIGDFKGPY
ncbi:DUF421 domain-containing protein [Hathewaya histolytica]|uniref:Membrane protein n=1 Tax=Hathewaya histolytica TaxID=1498 RepID=A0A4U9R491_HATHI|nr:DUF421 domain-containing protein [Hathewaya histolytica]VTQ86085.1 membrane protein [Hathewaya histolytica]